MKYTKEQLQQAEEISMLPGTTILDIAKILELDYMEVYHATQDSSDLLYKAITTGRKKSELELSEKINKLSASGSGPAQTIQLKMISNVKTTELRDYYVSQEKSI